MWQSGNCSVWCSSISIYFSKICKECRSCESNSIMKRIDAITLLYSVESPVPSCRGTVLHPLSGRLKGDVSEDTSPPCAGEHGVARQGWEQQVYGPLHPRLLARVTYPGTEVPTPYTPILLQMDWGEHSLSYLNFQNQLARISFVPWRYRKLLHCQSYHRLGFINQCQTRKAQYTLSNSSNML